VPKPHGAKVRIAPEARIDIRAALVWSERNFGKAAAGRYRALIQQALRDIGAEPERPGSTERSDLTAGGRTYHVSLSRSRVVGVRVKEPRHFLVYRRDQGQVEVIRVLHDARDFAEQVPQD